MSPIIEQKSLIGRPLPSIKSVESDKTLQPRNRNKDLVIVSATTIIGLALCCGGLFFIQSLLSRFPIK